MNEHSEAVARLIRQRIADEGGWIAFETFMELALYAPGYGYYSAGSVKLGPGGDFVTAPEISDLFSICVARQCAEVLRFTGGSILELGAGTGRMAATVLEHLASLDALPSEYAILEVSADLRERQQHRIARLVPELRERVKWLDRLPERPIRGVIVANEVLDALPCHRFIVRGQSVRALGVAVDEQGAFTAREGEASEALTQAAAPIVQEMDLPEGYTSEICLRVEPWITSLADCLESGAMLLFDYGLPRRHYYHPQRSTGTLRCHFRQRVHDDPFVNVGLQDITAWVDFTRVAEGADAAGLAVSGFATQAAFLLGTGIHTLAAADADEKTRIRQAGELNRLLLPGEMGEAFKVMALTRNMSAPLSGFALQDLRHSL